MPPRSVDRCETQAGLIWLLAVAARHPAGSAEIVARTLTGIGWTLAGGTPLSTLDADRAAWDGAGSPNEDGAGFARAAVISWPGAATARSPE